MFTLIWRLLCWSKIRRSKWHCQAVGTIAGFVEANKCLPGRVSHLSPEASWPLHSQLLCQELQWGLHQGCPVTEQSLSCMYLAIHCVSQQGLKQSLTALEWELGPRWWGCWLSVCEYQMHSLQQAIPAAMSSRSPVQLLPKMQSLM